MEGLELGEPAPARLDEDFNFASEVAVLATGTQQFDKTHLRPARLHLDRKTRRVCIEDSVRVS